jgi:hypothetical protein
MKEIKEVASALINLQDHGGDCMCNICQKDQQTIEKNPEIAEQLTVLVNKKINV